MVAVHAVRPTRSRSARPHRNGRVAFATRSSARPRRARWLRPLFPGASGWGRRPSSLGGSSPPRSGYVAGVSRRTIAMLSRTAVARRTHSPCGLRRRRSATVSRRGPNRCGRGVAVAAILAAPARIIPRNRPPPSRARSPCQEGSLAIAGPTSGYSTPCATGRGVSAQAISWGYRPGALECYHIDRFSHADPLNGWVNSSDPLTREPPSRRDRPPVCRTPDLGQPLDAPGWRGHARRETLGSRPEPAAEKRGDLPTPNPIGSCRRRESADDTARVGTWRQRHPGDAARGASRGVTPEFVRDEVARGRGHTRQRPPSGWQWTAGARCRARSNRSRPSGCQRGRALVGEPDRHPASEAIDRAGDAESARRDGSTHRNRSHDHHQDQRQHRASPVSARRRRKSRVRWRAAYGADT
jgi:hypothetical protein